MKILFICRGNMFRSQMAEALYNKLSNTIDAISAGTYVGAPDAPEGQIISEHFKTLDFFELMEKNGMYIRDKKTRKLTSEMLAEADITVAMVQDPYIPDFLRNDKKVVWWNIKDPSRATKEVSESTYAQLSLLITDLISKNLSK